MVGSNAGAVWLQKIVRAIWELEESVITIDL